MTRFCTAMAFATALAALVTAAHAETRSPNTADDIALLARLTAEVDAKRAGTPPAPGNSGSSGWGNFCGKYVPWEAGYPTICRMKGY